MAKICDCNDGPWPDPYNFCPSCGKQLDSLRPSDETACSPSLFAESVIQDIDRIRPRIGRLMEITPKWSGSDTPIGAADMNEVARGLRLAKEALEAFARYHVQLAEDAFKDSENAGSDAPGAVEKP